MKKTLSLRNITFVLALGAVGHVAQAQTITGRVNEGEKKTAMCIGCHGIVGYQASFPQVHKVPMISGQNAKYITNALGAYKTGERKHPTMQSIAASLTEQDMADLAAFYEQHDSATPAPAVGTPPEPSAAVQSLLQKGACVTCHGANFSQPTNGAAKLAGQHPDYLYVALKSYQTTHNPVVGRANAVMAGQIKDWSHDELKAVAQYLSTLPGELKVVPQSRFRAANP